MTPRASRTASVLVLLASACAPAQQATGPINPTLAATPPVIPDDVVIPAANHAATQSCDPTHAAALRVFPGDATMVAGANLAALIQTPAFSSVFAGEPPKAAEPLLDAAAECGIGRDAWRSITFAMDIGGSKVAFALRADGAGSPERLGCIRNRLRSPGAATDPFTVSTDGGAIELRFPDGDMGWVIDPCTVVIASEPWTAATRARVQGFGTSLAEGPLASAIARADDRKHAWIAAKQPAASMTGSPLDGAQDFAASIQATTKVAFSASVAFADPSTAAKRGTELSRQFDQMKSMFGPMGIPQSMVDRIRIGAAGAFVMVSAEADETEIAAVVKLFRAM